MNTFLLKRTIDLSLLTNGFQIPLEFHSLVYALYGEIPHGENKDITIQIGMESYKAKIYNINFDQKKYPNHPDLLQIRYSPTSQIAKRLQSIFIEEYNYLLKERQLIGPRKQIKLPNEFSRSIVLYGTDLKDLFLIDVEEGIDRDYLKNSIHQLTEEEFEVGYIHKDPTATIREINDLKHVRHLDRSIGDSLKKLYDYRCQMTGVSIGKEYGATCVEAHHIIPFTQSFNNDTSNIIILSPNYHRIIHRANPIFNVKELAFEFPNGLIEKVKLDKHLYLSS